jgi:hypothetical protein
MLIPDVNVLVYAVQHDASAHERYLRWFEDSLAGPEPVGLVALVVAGFLRIVTNPRIFASPIPPGQALTFVEAALGAPACVVPAPSVRHMATFLDVCRAADAKGDLIPDAWLAATAIDLDATLVTADRGFARFPGLRWRHPLG